MSRSLLLSVSAALAVAAPVIAGGSFTTIGPGVANDVSGDGSTVVGGSSGQGFRWTLSDGFVLIGGLSADAVNADGSVIAGTVSLGNGDSAARWTETDGWSDGFGPLGASGCDAFLSSSYDISGDGSTIVGLGWDGCDAAAFVWTMESGMTALPQLGPNSSRANAISADGSIVGGWDEAATGPRRAAIWLSDDSEVLLLEGVPGNADGFGEVYNFTSDGTIIVGQNDSADPSNAGPFLYSKSGGFEFLGPIPGTNPVVAGALDLSDDASVVVGFQREGFGPFAVFDATIWTADTGLVRLSDYLTDRGIAVPDGLQLASAQAISDDGTVIAGWGYEGFIFAQQAWVVHLPGDNEPCPADLNTDGMVDGADLGLLLGAWGPCDACSADLNADGVVDGADLGLLLGAWGPCAG